MQHTKTTFVFYNYRQAGGFLNVQVCDCLPGSQLTMCSFPVMLSMQSPSTLWEQSHHCDYMHMLKVIVHKYTLYILSENKVPAVWAGATEHTSCIEQVFQEHNPYMYVRTAVHTLMP